MLPSTLMRWENQGGPSMPLLKLWNTIRGNSPAKRAKDTAGQTAKSSSSPKLAAAQAAPEKPTLSLLDRFGGGPHAAICKLVRTSGAMTVLEIGVGDGERALAMTAALANAQSGDDSGRSVRYIAIDMFEMANGPVTLKDFHKRIRGQGVQPTLVPMDVCGGLNRVSSTIGAVDMVFLAEPNEQIEMLQVRPLLRKISADHTLIYELQGDQWQKLNLDRDANDVGSVTRRAA
jgi:hypothetical protein